MPKLKSHRGAAKRFRVTKNGLVKHASSNRRHILTKKSRKRKRNLRKKRVLSDAETVHIRRFLPYDF